MACYNPLDAYRLEGGGVSVGFERKGSTEKLRIPCGTCFGCRMEYAELWSIRCQHESKLWESSLFVTLTYDDDSLPWHGSLDVSHIQRFIKRLRKAYDGDIAIPESAGRRPIRYFAAGEYGTSTERAHWHLLLFNCRLPDYHGGGPGIDLKSMSGLWPFGHHRVDLFAPGRASYIAGYSAKKARGRVERKKRYEVMNMETGEVFERRPEFCVMSRRPGIGVWYFQRHRADFERGFVQGEGGVKKRLPRLYRTYLSESSEFAYDDENRREEFLLAMDPAENTRERLAVRQKVHQSRIGTYRKERL